MDDGMDVSPHVPNQIVSFWHCKQCLIEKPSNTSARDWARLEVGTTANGSLQIYCVRHDINVLYVSSES